MKEMTVHTWFKNQMKKRFGKDFLYIKSPAGIYSSRRGISDFICVVRGHFIAVEVKRDKGMKPTLIQQNFLDEVEVAGGLGLCLAGKDDAVLDQIDKWSKDR